MAVSETFQRCEVAASKTNGAALEPDGGDGAFNTIGQTPRIQWPTSGE